jgi:hypothetical protein
MVYKVELEEKAEARISHNVLKICRGIGYYIWVST